MSIEQVKSEIRRFLGDKDRLALCLSGKWGVGKTHTWEALLDEAFKNNNAYPSRYAYVSLFGLESLGDVRRSLFENTVESVAFKAVKPFEATTSSVLERLAYFASKWRARGLPCINRETGDYPSTPASNSALMMRPTRSSTFAKSFHEIVVLMVTAVRSTARPHRQGDAHQAREDERYAYPTHWEQPLAHDDGGECRRDDWLQ